MRVKKKVSTNFVDPNFWCSVFMDSFKKLTIEKLMMLVKLRKVDGYENMSS